MTEPIMLQPKSVAVPSPDCVNLLAKLLMEAKMGNIRSVGIAAVGSDGSPTSYLAMTPGVSNPHVLVASVAYLGDVLRDRIVGAARASQKAQTGPSGTA